MKTGLAVYAFQNGRLAYNMGQIEKAMRAAQGKVDLLCFGEAFLQGFDCLCWQYEKDRNVALAQQDTAIAQLCSWTRQYGIDLLLGYIEREGERLYSSCIVLAAGRILHNYRRISQGWKEFSRTDAHYAEGETVRAFEYRGQSLMIALCGDLWDMPQRFQTEGLLIWPVYVNFSRDEWKRYADEYAAQAALAAEHALMVNSLSDDPPAHGGAYAFCRGQICSRLPLDQAGILVVDTDGGAGCIL